MSAHLRIVAFLTTLATFSASACASELDATEAAPLTEDGPPTDDELAKADWFGNTPETWRRFWYAKYYYQLHAPIEAGEQQAPFAGTRTVLLIPGTTIGPEFFVPMATRLRRDGFDPVIWAPSDLFTDSLEVGAGRIAAKVEAVLEERGESRLHIVAECDGGVAARFFAQILGGEERIDQLVTFVSAHHGSAAAPFGAWFTSWPALRDIRPYSEFMTELNSAPMPAGLQLTSIYTCWDEYLWPYETSYVDGATNVEFCDHAIGHFAGFWDRTVYERILITLRGEGASAPVYY